MAFCHLHVHSYYSLLDGLCSPEELAERAKELKMPAIALTDHGNMFGAVEFYEACKEQGIKPIIGMEAYVAPDLRHNKELDRDALKYTHLTLLAKNQVGYETLMKLSKLSYTEGFYYKPRIDMELLTQYRDGLICLSGCMGSALGRIILAERYEIAERLVFAFHSIFGEDFYLELMDTGVEEQKIINMWITRIARDTDMKAVVTNDVHMINPDDIEAQMALSCIRSRKVLHEVQPLYLQNWLKPEKEMLKLFPREYVERTTEIADKCTLELKLNRKYHIGDPEKAFKEIKEQCDEKIKGYSREYVERYSYEMEAIKKTGYAEYIKVVSDFVEFAKLQKIPMGSGRGSSASSLVCFLLGITDIDPIHHGLVFERFINVDRVGPPDIDVDTCQVRRGEIIDYIREKYGTEKVAQIITFGRLRTKAVIKDVCKVLNLPPLIGDDICKLIEEPWEGTVEEIFTDRKIIGYLQEHMAPELVDRIKRISIKLEGRPRHTSTHAAGIVISSTNLDELVPLCTKGNTPEILTQYDMYSIEKLGLLKFDILGLRTLTVISGACKSANIERSEIPLNDEATFRGIRNGNTRGVFQYEGWGYTKFIKRMRPRTFNHLIDLGALYRPGPLNSGMADLYIQRMNINVDWDCFTKELTPILDSTYGIMLYQEQIMRVATVLANFSMNEADTLRKAIGKKDEELMDKMILKLGQGMIKQGYNKEFTDGMIENIITFARYGWNKAHAVSYALLSYWTAYLKFNYPLQYFCALLNSEINNAKKLNVLKKEAERSGVNIRPPHINISDIYYTIHNKQLYSGLLSIKGIGEKIYQYITKEREKGEFQDATDLRNRIPPKHLNSRIFQILIEHDVFSSLPPRLNELHIDTSEKTSCDLIQIKALCEDCPGDTRLHVHTVTGTVVTDTYIDKEKILERIKQICEVIY